MVLPALVPPATTMFQPPATASVRNASPSRADAERRERDLPAGEPPDRDARPVDGERWEGRVEARTVGEAGVDDGRGPIETKAQAADDALDEAADRIGVEIECDRLDAPVPFDVRAAGTVDHHLGDLGIGEVRFERTEAR